MLRLCISSDSMYRHPTVSVLLRPASLPQFGVLTSQPVSGPPSLEGCATFSHAGAPAAGFFVHLFTGTRLFPCFGRSGQRCWDRGGFNTWRSSCFRVFSARAQGCGRWVLWRVQASFPASPPCVSHSDGATQAPTAAHGPHRRSLSSGLLASPLRASGGVSRACISRFPHGQ